MKTLNRMSTRQLDVTALVAFTAGVVVAALCSRRAHRAWTA